MNSYTLWESWMTLTLNGVSWTKYNNDIFNVEKSVQIIQSNICEFLGK
jgi:hypothetical protein